jgi:hypothetical protein
MAVTSDFIPKAVYQDQNGGKLEGFINATMWFHPVKQCWARSYWTQEDIITCTDPSVPNCLSDVAAQQTQLDEVTALSYNFWVARLIFRQSPALQRVPHTTVDTALTSHYRLPPCTQHCTFPLQASPPLRAELICPVHVSVHARMGVHWLSSMALTPR